MPARVHKIRHDEQTRAKIKAAQIINRLQACVDGTVTLDAQQVSAAKTLLNKVLPDLSAVTLSGDQDNPIRHKVELDAERFTRSIAGLAARSGAGESPE